MRATNFIRLFTNQILSKLTILNSVLKNFVNNVKHCRRKFDKQIRIPVFNFLRKTG